MLCLTNRNESDEDQTCDLCFSSVFFILTITTAEFSKSLSRETIPGRAFFRISNMGGCEPTLGGPSLSLYPLFLPFSFPPIFSPPLPSLLDPIPSLPFPFSSPPLEVGPLNPARDLGSAVSCLSEVCAEPRPKLNLVHFTLKS